MSLHDDLADIAMMVRGIRDARAASDRLPFIVGRLQTAVRSVKRLRPGRQRMPGLDHAVDWLYRSAMDAPLDDRQRAEVLALVGELKAMVGAEAIAPARP